MTRSVSSMPSATAYRCSSSTGRFDSMTVAVGPRTSVNQAASSSAFDTVADRHTRRTCWGTWMMTSSHTGPR